MMCERRGLKFSFKCLKADILLISPGVSINKTDSIVISDGLGQFRVQLQQTQQIWQSFPMIKGIDNRVGFRTPHALRKRLEDVPGNAVIFSIRIAIPYDQGLFQETPPNKEIC